MDNKIKPAILLAVLACAGLAPIAAETAPAVLSVDQAVDAALRNNLAVKSAATESRIKKRANDFSFNRFYPSVSTTATALKLNTVSPVLVGVPTSNGLAPYYVTPDKANLALGLTVQEVFSVSYLELMDQAALDYQESLIGKAKAEKTIAAAVKKLFYQLLVQKEAIELTRSRLDNARERLRQARVSYELGQGTELNYRYAKANVEALIPDLRSMETARRQAVTQFQEILGLDKRDDMDLSGSLEDEKIPSADETTIEGARFDVKKSYMSVNQLETALRLQDSTLLPNLIVQYTADPTLNGPSKNSIWDKGNWGQSSGALSLTLSVNLSGLIPGSDYRVKRSELEDRLALARENAETTARNASHDEENQRRLIRDSLDKIENLKDVAVDTKRSYELTDAYYKAGVGRLLDLEDAELSWQSTQIQLLNERLNLMSLIYDLDAQYETAN
jgi:outer membrane protein TolC